MIVAIHQPNYVPWLGYFYKICHCDVFVFLDSVPYSRNSLVNRNRIKIPQGLAWLTVGVLTKGHYAQAISEVEVNNSVDWRKTHWRTISQNYSKTPHFKEYESLFEAVYDREWRRLIDLNETLIQLISSLLGTNTVMFVNASALKTTGTRSELLVNICKAVGADTYLSGFGGRKYLDESGFQEAGVRLVYSDFEHPVYGQLWGEFVPNLSIIDLLFNEGERSRSILNQHGRTGSLLS